MEKINIAEILKNCPQGMELDCTMFDDVIFERIDSESHKVCIVLIRLKSNTTFYASEYGQFYNAEDAKCVIFPKGKTTWEGFVPPCKFKEGDVVVTTFGSIAIIKEPSGWEYTTHVIMRNKILIPGIEVDASRLATEEEKQKLFKAIKKSGYKWNEETKTLEELYHYPKTLYECCAILGLTELGIIGGYRSGLLTQFRNLLICRDAYWEIGGEGGWKPEFRFGKKKYCIMTKDNKVISATVEETNRNLVFPTEEMRDAFFENFKELIKECISLL